MSPCSGLSPPAALVLLSSARAVASFNHGMTLPVPVPPPPLPPPLPSSPSHSRAQPTSSILYSSSQLLSAGDAHAIPNLSRLPRLTYDPFLSVSLFTSLQPLCPIVSKQWLWQWPHCHVHAHGGGSRRVCVHVLCTHRSIPSLAPRGKPGQ